MRTLKLFVLCVCTIGMGTMYSCSTEGCTDPESTNYSIDADKDDGSCLYEGSVTFWYGESTSLALSSNGSHTLTYYVDGVNIGSSPVSAYLPVAPDCDDSGSMNYTRNLGSNKTGQSFYEIKDEDGFLRWSDNITFTANTCESIELY